MLLQKTVDDGSWHNNITAVDMRLRFVALVIAAILLSDACWRSKATVELDLDDVDAATTARSPKNLLNAQSHLYAGCWIHAAARGAGFVPDARPRVQRSLAAF